MAPEEAVKRWQCEADSPPAEVGVGEGDERVETIDSATAIPPLTSTCRSGTEVVTCQFATSPVGKPSHQAVFGIDQAAHPSRRKMLSIE